MTPADTSAPHPPGTASDVFRAFLRLGLRAFGGPVAHLGYMRDEFVLRRRWLDEATFAQLLAVCQFLPGPASSQLGFAIGLLRAGWRGALAAFAGFTLPSALLMFAFAVLAPAHAYGVGADAVHGLKLVAVAVVAHGLVGMARQHAAGAWRAVVAIASAVLVVWTQAAWAQLVAIAVGGGVGMLALRSGAIPKVTTITLRYGRRTATVLSGVFAIGLVAALLRPATATPHAADVAAAFYRAGALVFGGGHVVLPLLQQTVVDPGWIGADTFLAGYGAAQAVPGPMFSLAAFLGADIRCGLPAFASAVIALVALFLPGFLLLVAALPAWARLARQRWAAGAIAGVNAAVVGLLAAAFYRPVWSEGIRDSADAVIALAGFVLLAKWRVPALWIVLGCVAASVAVGAWR